MDNLIYAICLAVGLLFTIVSAVLGHFFGGTDGHGRNRHRRPRRGRIRPHRDAGDFVLQPTVLASFVTAFGAFGLILTRIPATSSVWASAPLSAIGGGIIAWLVFMLFNAMFSRTQSSSESRIASVVGQTASVITPIPVGGVGEIAYVQGGTRYTAPAREENEKAVGNGRTVKICRVAGSQFYVQSLD